MGKKYVKNNVFVSVSDRLPKEFQLCILKDSKGKTAIGWFVRNSKDGFVWDGMHMDKIDQVKEWKRSDTCRYNFL